MFSKISFVLAGLLAVAAADTLPMTAVISVIQASTGSTIGSLTGYGNFSSPGPSYPFHVVAQTGGFSTVSGYGLCIGGGGLLECEPGATSGDLFDEVNGNLVLQGTDGTWSVDATTDAAGGVNQFGLKNGIPVHLGNSAAIPVTLKVVAASG